MSLKSILLDNQTFHAVFNKCQQMATLRMTLKTTYTETKTKQQLFWFLVLVFGFSLCNEQNTNCQLPLNTSKDKMSLKSNLKELKPTLFLISTIDQVKAREIFQSVALKKHKEKDFQCVSSVCNYFLAYEVITPPRTPRISRLKSQIMNPTFLS